VVWIRFRGEAEESLVMVVSLGPGPGALLVFLN